MNAAGARWPALGATHVFDAYGTLFDVHSAVARLAGEIGPAADRLSQIWRTKQLEQTWVLALAGRHERFRVLTERALDIAIASTGGLAADLRRRLLEAYDTLAAYPEVPGALAALAGEGSRLAILSNGDPDMLRTAVRSAGLEGRFLTVLSVAEVGIFKPSPQVYQLAVDRLGTPAGEIVFVSSNRWDVAGARAFGLRPVWVNRVGAPDEYPDLAPERVVTSLEGLIARSS